MTYLAYTYSPEQADRWMCAARGSRSAYYAEPVRDVFGTPLDEAWQRLDRVRARVPAANLAAVREHPITPHTRCSSPRGAGLGVARLPTTPSAARLYAAFSYPGRRRAPRRDSTRDRRASSKLAGRQGAGASTRVTSLAFDPDAAHALLHHRQLRVPRPLALDLDTGEDADAAEGRAHRRPRLQPRRPVAVGHPPPRTASSTLVRIPYPYDELGADLRLPVRHRSSTTSTSRPTAAPDRPRMADDRRVAEPARLRIDDAARR